MPVNVLTSEVGIKIGPIVLETLVKHYFERTLKNTNLNGTGSTQLRKDELLYDEAFNIVKAFLEASTKHSVEELQRFSNMRTPSPPWVHVVKVCVPMTSCDEAATYLIKALGGEELTKRLVGGTKWWQVRGVKGVDAEWMAAKKDWDDAEKRFKAHERQRTSTGDFQRSPSTSSEQGVNPNADAHYQPEMDEMRCILYAHGGGYYFGSVDQERYSIQRHARKIKGRVFAINYRLAPQYPFPCAIQDMLAAYLYLIRPPEGSLHRPVKPAHIVVAGDSAGGGLCIALLQVLRDTGLPMPAGGVLISPWCDLTHSFPSVHLNTATDVIPPYGLSLYKPSTLWPPPPDEITATVQESIRSRIRQAVHSTTKGRTKNNPPETIPLRHPEGEDPNLLSPTYSVSYDVQVPETGHTLHLGSSASLPIPDSSVRSQSVSCQTADGKTLTIDDQVHLYAPNYLLQHPLVSPVVSYLGGLPPLLVIASDKEVLRDEIIYFAHKAAHPEKYLVKEETRAMYPALYGIENKYGPTKVHLQVYDDTAHVLPVLFSFTTPAKYCYRAIASFIKLVTGMVPPAIPEGDSSLESIVIVDSPPGTPFSTTDPNGTPPRSPLPRMQSTPSMQSDTQRQRSQTQTFRKKWDEDKASRMSLRRAFSASITRASTALASPKNLLHSPRPNQSTFENQQAHANSVDVGGPRFQDSIDSETGKAGVKTAGEDNVYANGLKTMIRERVSTRGVIRPLEPESELSAFSLPPELVGVVSELALRRYLDGKAKFDKKFHSTTKTIAKRRQRHFDTAKRDAVKKMNQLQTYLEDGQIRQGSNDQAKEVKENVLEIGSWNWAWALDGDEHPPPSSIVSRRDTAEAVELARIADQSVLSDEHMFSGNNLWSMVVNFLTVVPDSKHSHHHRQTTEKKGGATQKEPQSPKRERFRSIFAQFSKQQQKDSHEPTSSPEHSPEIPTKEVAPTSSSS